MKVNGNAGIYTVTGGSVTVKFDYMKSERAGVRARVMVMDSNLPPPSDQITSSTVNISGPNGRRDLARRCEEAAPRNTDMASWARIIDMACTDVERVYLEGEPVIDFTTFEPSTTGFEYLIDPYLVKNSPNMFFAHGSGGKSYLSAVFAAIAQTGVVPPWVRDARQANVLMLDWESDEDDAYARMTEAYDGLGVGRKPTVKYKRCFLGLPSDLQEVQKAILEYDIGLVIVDTGGPACGGNPNDADVTLAFFAALRSLDVTSMILCHVPKTEPGKPKKAFGSVHWENQPRSVWELRKDQEVGESKFRLDMVHAKVNRGPRLRPRALEFEFSDYWNTDDPENSLSMVQVSAIDRENVPGFVEQFAPIDQIELLMITSSAPMTARQIYEELGMSVSFNEVKKAIARGKAEGAFVALAGNRFGLTRR